MRPALFYGIITGYCLGAESARIMVVTSEKGRLAYGRDLEHGNPTHCRTADIRARFATEEEALQHLSQCRQLSARYRALRAPLSETLSALHRAEEADFRRVVRGEAPQIPSVSCVLATASPLTPEIEEAIHSLEEQPS